MVERAGWEPDCLVQVLLQPGQLCDLGQAAHLSEPPLSDGHVSSLPLVYHEDVVTVCMSRTWHST